MREARTARAPAIAASHMRTTGAAASAGRWLRTLLLAASLVASLKITLGVFGLDPDALHSLIVWQGVKENGAAWIKEWMFPQDNWLLSLIPLHVLGFSVFGDRPALAIFSGWLIFALSAAVSAGIARKIGGARAGFVVCLALLNLGLYAHQGGMFSYSVEHNITNLYGLASAWLLLAWVSAPRNLLLASMLVLLVCGAVSDPWMLPAYLLPTLLVGLCSLVWPETIVRRRDAWKLVSVALLSLVLARTKILGLLAFLPSIDFSLADRDTIDHNALYLVKDLGGLFNIVPFASLHGFLPALLSFSVLLLLLQYGTHMLHRHRATLPPPCAAFLALAVFSSAGMCGALLLSDVRAGDASARFLINVSYLLVVTLGTMAQVIRKHAAGLLRFLPAGWFAAFLLANLASTFSLLATGGFEPKDTGVSGTIEWLRANRLSFGFGSYWGANANAVTAASNGAIRLRPVVFDKEDGQMRVGTRLESSRRWSSADDVPAGTDEFFFYLRQDPEECPDVEACRLRLLRQFGPPHRILERNDASILVWKRESLSAAYK